MDWPARREKSILCLLGASTRPSRLSMQTNPAKPARPKSVSKTGVMLKCRRNSRTRGFLRRTIPIVINICRPLHVSTAPPPAKPRTTSPRSPSTPANPKAPPTCRRNIQQVVPVRQLAESLVLGGRPFRQVVHPAFSSRSNSTNYSRTPSIMKRPLCSRNSARVSSGSRVRFRAFRMIG